MSMQEIIPPSSRRFFLRLGAGSVAAAAGSLAVLRGRSAVRADNPFALDLEQYRRVDPKLVQYERVSRVRCPRRNTKRIAIDAQDRLYVAAGNSIIVLDTNGSLLKEIACAGPARCVQVSADGLIWVGLRERVEVYDAEGQRKVSWEPVAGRPFLTGLAIGEDDVFVADAGNRIILRYDRSGRLLGRIGEKDAERDIAGFVVPSPYLDVELAPDGLLRVNNPGRHRVEAYTFDGELQFYWGKPSAAIEGFCGCCNPVNLELLNDGRCVTFEKGLPRVKIYGVHGNFECVVAGPDTFADLAKEFPSSDLDDPSMGGLDGVIDSTGRIHVLEMVTGDLHTMRRKEAA